MLDKDALRRLLDYTRWANHRIVRAAATLTVDEFRRDLNSSHGGVRGTLVHMMWAELIWLERWKGLPNPRPFDESEFADVLALRERWNAVDEHRSAWFAELSADGPAAIVRYKTMDGKPYEEPLWQLVQHVANHATYHRGQVTTFLRQLGAKAVNTDMVTWDREGSPSKTRRR
jgi:uncharacterized damage-inducible protein DinB